MIYRDLKPENILMDSKGHIKLSDFGLSKILSDNDEKAFTMCGTPQYLAPEIMKEEGYDKNVDWWSLGCFFYEMITGFLPFYIPKDYLNEKVYEQKVIFPSGVNPLAIKFIKELLVVDPMNSKSFFITIFFRVFILKGKGRKNFSFIILCLSLFFNAHVV